MTKKYEIKQRRTSYTAPASELMSAMKKNRWDFDQLISYHIKVRENDPQVLKVLPLYVVTAMRDLSPLELIKQCDAVIHPQNDNDIENDFVAKKFFEKSATWDKCLIVNPNPSFFEAYKKYAERLEITYSSDLMVQLLESEPTLKKFRFCRMGDVTTWNGINRALVFAGQETEENCEQILRHLKEVMVVGAGTNIYVYIPNVFVDSKKYSLAEGIFAHFTVHGYILIDAKTVSTAPKKKALFVLRNTIERDASCVAQEAKLVTNKRKRYLELSPEVAVAYQEMTERRKTLIGIYTHAMRGVKAETRVRQPARVYEFSPEIAIHVTFLDRQDDGSCRGAYGFRDWATTIQRRRNITQYGALFATPVHGKRLPSEEEAYQYAEKILFVNQKLGELIRLKTVEHFKKRPLTIKTIWYLFQEPLAKNEAYKHEICVEFFAKLRQYGRELWESPVTAENEEKLIEAASEYAKKQGLSFAAEKRLYEQLALIVDFGKNVQHASVNPFRDLLSEKADRKNKEQEKRNALMLSSRDLQSVGEMLNIALNDYLEEPLAIGCLIKMFTAMSTGEACALLWGDFQKVTNLDLYHILVTKHFTGRETQPRAFTADEQYRAIPLISWLTKLLKEFKMRTIERLKSKVKDEVDISSCPILYCSDDPTKPVNPESLNRYVKSVLAKVAPQSHFLLTAGVDGKEIVTDISKYRGDLFRANWEFHAVHTMGMTMDEIAYIKGVKPATVAARNYLDFGCGRSQMVLQKKMERWAAICLADKETRGVVCKYGECIGESVVQLDISPYRCELLLDMKIPAGRTTVEISAMHGATVAVDHIQRGRS